MWDPLLVLSKIHINEQQVTNGVLQLNKLNQQFFTIFKNIIIIWNNMTP